MPGLFLLQMNLGNPSTFYSTAASVQWKGLRTNWLELQIIKGDGVGRCLTYDLSRQKSSNSSSPVQGQPGLHGQTLSPNFKRKKKTKQKTRRSYFM